MAMLEKIHSPEDIKGFDGEELESLCEEMRRVIIDTVSANGGHLASNLGVVELTVALGLAFSPPRDTIVWDVGHQSYPYIGYAAPESLRRIAARSWSSPCPVLAETHSPS